MKKLLNSPITTVVLFVVAAGMLLFSTVGGARAALTYFSENYVSRVSMMTDIGVTLVQDTENIAWRDYSSAGDGTWDTNDGAYERDQTDGPYASLLSDMISEGETFRFGREYPLNLAAYNSGSIDEFVRMTIYTYWVGADGEKDISLNPDYIKIGMANQGSWLLDEESTTSERRVYYYNTVLSPGQTTPYLCDSIMIDSDVIRVVTQTESNGVITTTYDYAGAKFQLKVVVDAVQTHNADDAIWSAWGRRLTYNGSTLSFVN